MFQFYICFFILSLTNLMLLFEMVNNIYSRCLLSLGKYWKSEISKDFVSRKVRQFSWNFIGPQEIKKKFSFLFLYYKQSAIQMNYVYLKYI